MSSAPGWLRPTVRLRLTLWYGGLFLLAGVLLLGLNYVLVRRGLDPAPGKVRAVVAERLGISEDVLIPPGEFGRPPDGAGVGRPPDGPDNASVAVVGQVPVPVLLREVQDELKAEALRQLFVKSGVALSVMAVLSLGLGWVVAGRMLRPVHDITAKARQLSEATLHERIALQGPPDELKELADTFDAMLGRLEGAFNAQREFVANASHELRTPLTIIRAEVDVAAADPDPSKTDVQAMADAVRAGVDRSEQLIDSLLLLARSEGSLVRERIDLADLAAEALERARPEMTAAGLDARPLLQSTVMEGDPALLERLVDNLVQNAVRHNEPHGWLTVETVTEEGAAVLRVANGGAVIAAADASRLFERFYRVDHSRSRKTGGAGLGLSIVRAVAEAHGGVTEAEAPSAGGLVVTVRLPVAAPVA